MPTDRLGEGQAGPGAETLARLERITSDPLTQERIRKWIEEEQGIARRWRFDMDEKIQRLEAALRASETTIKSLAFMLGWQNVPPQETLERSISALFARLRASEAALAEARKKEREACASHGCNRCRLLLADSEAR